MGASLVASWLPARRAGHIDALDALCEVRGFFLR